jgi:hypothetical protein
MIEIIKELQIEVSKPNVFQAIVAKQYDMNTRFLKVTFVDNKEKISINHSETVSVIINALRPDGQSKGFDGEINNDGTVTVPLHSWMLELVGTVVCDISVIDTATKDNKRLTTTSFTLYVEQAAWGGEGVTSDPQYDILIQLVNDCATARANADIALEKSAEADAKYDACVEATERANQIINSSGILEKVKEQNTQGHIKFWVGTQEEYDNLEQMEGNCLHIITDDKTIEDLEDVKAKNLNTIDATNYFDLSSKYINHPVLIVLINYKETTTSTEGMANVVLTKTPLAYQGESVVLVNGTPKAIDYFLPIQDGFGDHIPTENKDGTITYTNVSLYIV